MKRTEIERRMREFKREQKVAEYLDNCGSEEKSINDYIEELYGMLYYNETEVMNIPDNMEIFELMEGLKAQHPEKQWHNVVKKAVRKTGVKDRKKATNELAQYLEM